MTRYCVTPPAETSITRTHKKKAKNRKSGQVRGQTAFRKTSPKGQKAGARSGLFLLLRLGFTTAGGCMFERLFDLKAQGVTARSEMVAGATVFFTMGYILFVNPRILAAAGMDPGAVFMATALSAAFTTLLMGLYANLPVALAPGMGHNAYFAFTVVPLLAGDWRLALGCVFLSGVLFVALSVSPAREWLINALPQSQKRAIGAGIGFFLALIGFEGAGLVAASKDTLLQPGRLTDPKLLVAAVGLCVIAALWARKVTGAVLIGIVTATLLAFAFKLQPLPNLSAPLPSIAPTFLQLHFTGAPASILAAVVFSFLFLQMLDTSGTLTAVGHQAGLMENGRLKNVRKALICDSTGSTLGAVLGTSSVTAYVESAAGAGGKTGLVAVTVGLMFLLSLVLAPIAGAVPAYATAPALVFVAVLFVKDLKDVDWGDITEALPALMTALAIPFTFSIAEGIGIGFVTYCVTKLLTARQREIPMGAAIIALAYAAKVAFT
jgi:AGZA family xanthine/uracil permease-like MFS transporter